MPLELNDDKSTLVKVITCYRRQFINTIWKVHAICEGGVLNIFLLFQ